MCPTTLTCALAAAAAIQATAAAKRYMGLFVTPPHPLPKHKFPLTGRERPKEGVKLYFLALGVQVSFAARGKKTIFPISDIVYVTYESV